MAAPVILVEAKPRRASDGAAVTVRLAGGGADFPYNYDAKEWKAAIAAVPGSVSKLDFDGLQLGGGGVPNAIEFECAPAGNAALAELASLFWTDAPISVWIGPEGNAMPPIEVAGLVLTAPIARGVMSVGLADIVVDLKRPLLVDRFKGTGGLEGPVEFEGQTKTRAWGRCFNVPGKVIDAGSNIWCFGDPFRQWQAIVAVRDVGVPADVADLAFLGWQGSAEQTLAALKVAAAPEGGGVLCPSIACVKWWTQNTAGDLHIDLRGEIEGGYVETAPEIAARIVTARSSLGFGPGELAAAVQLRSEPFGWRCANESTTAAAAVTEVLGDVGLSWVIAGGAIAFRPWAWSAPTRRAESQSVTRQELVKPVGTRKLGYRRNQAPMARGDLGAFVLGNDIVFEDGSTAADLAAQIARIVSDGWLSRDEKRGLRREWDALNALLDATEGQWVAIGSPADASDERDAARGAVGDLAALLVSLRPFWDDTSADTQVDAGTFNAMWVDARAKVELFAAAIRGRPGRDAPLTRTQWSIDGVNNWHDNYMGGDIYQRQSADGGATWGLAYRAIGESGDGASIVFRRSATVPATPGDNTGNPPAGWSDGPPAGDDFLWQTKATFRGSAQVTSWSAPVRISGKDGFVVDVDQPFFAIPVYSSGASKPSWSGGAGTIRLRKGDALVTDGVTYAIESQRDVAGVGLDGSRFRFSGITADTGSFVVAATYAGVTYRTQVDAKKVYDGSAAFRGSVVIQGDGAYPGAVVVGSGTTPIPGGSTVVLSANINYTPPEYGSQSTDFTGRVSLYYRNETDNGPMTFLGQKDGSTAFRHNIGTPTEPEFEQQGGEVSASFAFTSAAADKVYYYEARFESVERSPARTLISGGMRVEVTG